MTKKIIALILCAMMTLTGAIAETVDLQEVATWRVTIDGLKISYQGETVEPNPALEILFTREENYARGQISVLLDGATAMSLLAEYAGNTLSATAEGAQDTLVIDGADMFFEQYGLTADGVNSALDALWTLLPGSTAGLPDSLEGLTILGDRELTWTVEMNGTTLSAHILWEPHADGVPYISGDKNPCRYTFREMYPGDGTDIPATLSAQLEALMADPSVAALAELLLIAPTAEM